MILYMEGDMLIIKKIISLSLVASSIMVFSTFTSTAAADSSYSPKKSQVIQWEKHTDISTLKCWTIKFKSPVDENSLLLPGIITVTDSKGCLIPTNLFLDNKNSYVYVQAPEGGYTKGQTYYLNISKDLKFQDKSKYLKNPVQMEFSTDNIGTVSIDENSPIIGTNNSFGFNLAKNLLSEDTDKSQNMIISPLSISNILAMTQNGAENKTKQEILNCLGLASIDDNTINEEYYSLSQYYNNLTSTDLKVANSIWTNNDINLNSTFKNTAQKYYNSEIHSEDFSDPNTLKKINEWVKKSTKEQIKQIIDDISEKDQAILINSTYFKGKWKNGFSRDKTKKENFTLSSGKVISTDTMEDTSQINYLKGTNFQAISLPYYDGMEMDIFLPNKGTDINDFTKNITEEKFDKWINSFNDTNVLQQIPKFKINYGVTLNNTLKNLGMDQAFDSSKADFTKLIGETSKNPFYINTIKHKAAINVDEQGSEASAVTSIFVAGSPAPSSNEPISFKVDRPFFFVIRDSNYNLILFMGKVENPSTNTEN